jgi:hypothetical protein
VHPVEGRRLGSADVGAHVLQCVVAQGEKLAVHGEPGLDLGDPSRRRRAPGQVLEPVLRPADGNAERPGGEAEQHHVAQHRSLDAERPARIGRRQHPQTVAAEAERGGGDAVERERPLEVRPRRQPAGGLVPVAHDAVALDRQSGPPRHAERRPDDELRPGHRVVHVAVVEAPLVDRLRGRRVDDRVERLVVDRDELCGILCEVAVARDDDRERLADVACSPDGCGVVRRGRVDRGRERP